MTKSIWVGADGTMKPAKGVWVNQGGSWNKVKSVYVKKDGIWQQTFPPTGVMVITSSTQIQFPPGASMADFVLIGGGSAGSPAYPSPTFGGNFPAAGGGGGAGAVVARTGVDIESGVLYDVSIGAGGIAGDLFNTAAGASTFLGYTAAGGGSSNGGSVFNDWINQGRDGNQLTGFHVSNPSVPTAGNYGGFATYGGVSGNTSRVAAGGGGGGASVGGNATSGGAQSGNGGAGYFDVITQQYYAGGGAGGYNLSSTSTGGIGGLGGGGNPGAAATKYGSGGGGGNYISGNAQSGGNGFSGIAIIRYY